MAELDILVPVAEDLLNRFGKTVTLSTPASKEYDPNTQTTVEGSNISQTIKVTPLEEYKVTYIDGEVRKMTDLRCYLSPEGLSFIPENSQTLTVDGRDHTILYVQRHYSGDLIVLYELGLGNR